MKTSRVTAIVALLIAVAGAIPAFAASDTGGTAFDPQAEAREREVQRSTLRGASFRTVKATWYGPGLFGNRTACGQRLGRETEGVAHRRLRCGTRVAIRYRGRTVITRVIDRGPFEPGVELDLAYATAKRLGMLQTSRVRAATLRR